MLGELPDSIFSCRQRAFHQCQRLYRGKGLRRFRIRPPRRKFRRICLLHICKPVSHRDLGYPAAIDAEPCSDIVLTIPTAQHSLDKRSVSGA